MEIVAAIIFGIPVFIYVFGLCLPAAFTFYEQLLWWSDEYSFYAQDNLYFNPVRQIFVWILGIPGTIIAIAIWIVCLPIKKIVNSYQQKESEKAWKIRDELIKKQKEESERPYREKVEILFEKISKDIFISSNINDLPTKMLVYDNKIDLFYNTGQTKVLNYINYISENLLSYYTWWVTDGSEAEKKVNQPMLLAEKINAKADGCYHLHSKMDERISECAGETMHCYRQVYVELCKKQTDI